ncbi:prolyl 4-hydroxylase [Chloropicon primus]|uniref:Prolyl 4-hydroxylase n=1 Tax=Chloropicon primus TaxID=1764295 RepID=A0A5B8MRA1_9CHLO|nr:prolyl 4-hydroxylase [Chloropicon primus]UPR02180.1 prolyl 4-hydroxylase [Chloropicon primus]|eukprot:QDZ22963.1 prolyl 4-hydroxylase [Chloropicon primus]
MALLALAVCVVYYWMPKEYRAPELRNRNYAVEQLTLSLGQEGTSNETWLEVLSWSPRAFVVHNWLTDREADHMIELARDNLDRSAVSGDSGKTVTIDKRRTSWSASLGRYHTKVIGSVQEKVALLVGYPAIHGETLKVLRYNPTEKYTPHLDAYDRERLNGAPNRALTILMYLSEVEAGGETNFPAGKLHPDFDSKYSERKSQETRCDGALAYQRLWAQYIKGVRMKKDNSIKPKKGDALVFWDLDPACVYKDMASLHEGCPVISGEKWSATIWVREETHGQGTQGIAEVRERVRELYSPTKLETTKAGGRGLRKLNPKIY